MGWGLAGDSFAFGLSSGEVRSGSIGSGQISRFKLSSGTVNSGHVASGAVLGSLGGGAFSIASGSVGPNDLGSGAVVSGAIGSGAIITYARNVIVDTYTVSEIVSGVRCVQFTPGASGAIRVAMAAASGRIPAIGIVFENVASGQLAKVVRYGDVQPPSSEIGSGVCISGRPGGRTLWVGASGQVVVLSGGGPTIGVGATNSGAWGQRMGATSTSGAVLVDVGPGIQFSGAANITTNMQQWPV